MRRAYNLEGRLNDHFILRNEDAERRLLGSSLVYQQTAELVAEADPELFTSEANKQLHKAICSLVSKQEEVNLWSIRQALQKHNQWDESGHRGFSTLTLTAYADDSVHPFGAKQALRNLESVNHQRKLRDIARSTYDQTRARFLFDDEMSALADGLQQAAYEVISGAQTKDTLNAISASLGKVLADIHKYRTSKPDNLIFTGFHRLDAMTGGLKPGELTVIGARPSMGKTALALDIAMDAALDNKTVMCFSLEMSHEQISQRILAKKAFINLRLLRSYKLSDDEITVIEDKIDQFKSVPLWIDDRSDITPGYIKNQCVKVARNGHKPNLIVVDYLQLASSTSKEQNREREIAQISRNMKALSKELDCHVLLLSQLNRQLETRTNKRPILADFRESGAIEQDADIAIGLYRDFVYSNNPADEHKAECIVLKQRNGPTGIIELAWEPTTAQYLNMQEEEDDSQGTDGRVRKPATRSESFDNQPRATQRKVFQHTEDGDLLL
jgi:replicative DNA helicase